MAYQTIFKRYEFKYIITEEQKEKLLYTMAPYMRPDKYGRTIIRNIYFDTDNYRIIRESIEKPIYKEKLRIRSYKSVESGDTVFVELKKKYKHVVYKRRLALPKKDAFDWLLGVRPLEKPTQISEEIDYFMDYYASLHPAVFLSYEREAYFLNDDDNFRITFDENILFRKDDVSLDSESGGVSLLQPNTVLMEIKSTGGMPLWLTEFLSVQNIYKTSFSKYGTAYKNYILRKEAF